MSFNQNLSSCEISSAVFLSSSQLSLSSFSAQLASSTIEEDDDKDKTINVCLPGIQAGKSEVGFEDGNSSFVEYSFSSCSTNFSNFSSSVLPGCSQEKDLESMFYNSSNTTSTNIIPCSGTIRSSSFHSLQPSIAEVTTLGKNTIPNEEFIPFEMSETDNLNHFENKNNGADEIICDDEIEKDAKKNDTTDYKSVPLFDDEKVAKEEKSIILTSAFSIPTHLRVSEKKGKELVDSLMKPCDVEGQRFLEFMNIAESQESDKVPEDEYANNLINIHNSVENFTCFEEKHLNKTLRNKTTNSKSNSLDKYHNYKVDEKHAVTLFQNPLLENKGEKKSGFLKGLFDGVGGVANGWRRPNFLFTEKKNENLADRREFEIVNENDEKQNDNENEYSSTAMTEISPLREVSKSYPLRDLRDEKNYEMLTEMQPNSQNSENNDNIINDKKTEFEILLEKSHDLTSSFNTCSTCLQTSISPLSSSNKFSFNSFSPLSDTIIFKDNNISVSNISLEEDKGTKSNHIAAAIPDPKLETPKKPRTPYNVFLEKLKHPSCAHLVAAIRQFVEKFPLKLTRQNAASIIHPFLSRMQNSLLMTEAFSSTDDQSNSVLEGLEKFVIQKLHPRLFATEKFDEERDKSLFKKIRCLQWVEFEHLEIPTLKDSGALWSLAVSELNRLNKMKAPRDKVVLILNCCRVVINVLANQTKADGSRKMPSADDILPLLIYVIIKTNPPQLHSNIEFIQTLRHPSILISEDAYFFTQFCSAVAFIRDVGETETAQLHISKDDYKHYFEDAERNYYEELSAQKEHCIDNRVTDFSSGEKLHNISDSNNQNKNTSKVGSSFINFLVPPISNSTISLATSTTSQCPNRPPASFNNQLLKKQNVEIEKILKYMSEISTRYENVRNVKDLRIGELSELYEEYRELVKMKNKIQNFLNLLCIKK